MNANMREAERARARWMVENGVRFIHRVNLVIATADAFLEAGSTDPRALPDADVLVTKEGHTFIFNSAIPFLVLVPGEEDLIAEIREGINAMVAAIARSAAGKQIDMDTAATITKTLFRAQLIALGQ